MRIGLFAIKDIEAGEEITFDYQFERVGAKKQQCFCGSKNCRGFLGEKPNPAEKKSNYQKKGKVNSHSHLFFFFLFALNFLSKIKKKII